MLGMRRQQVKEITTTPKFGYYKEFIVDTEHIVESNNVLVPTDLSKDVDFLLQLCNVLWIIAEHDALASILLSLSRPSTVAFRLSTRCNTDLAIGALANHKISMK